MKLADRIVLEGMPMFRGDYELMKKYRARTEEIQKMLFAEVPVIVVDNVADYLWHEGFSEDDWSYSPASFPNVAPPFDVWWMEYEKPRGVDFEHVEHVGALVTAFDMDSPYASELRLAAAQIFNALDEGVEVKWLVQWQQVISRPMGALAASTMLLAVAPTGEPVGGVLGALEDLLYTKDVIQNDDDYGRLVGGSFQLLRPMLLALSMMHCRNVNMVEQQAPRHERRRAEKTGKPQPLRFSTINITPMQRVLRGEGNSGEVGLKKAMHICRGHFKHFDEKPLFGRVRGTFWWGSQVRGTSSRGKVVHDYKVEPQSGTD